MSEPELVQRRALFALNSLLRGNAIEQINFIKTYHGLSILGNSFSERSPQVQLKAVILLTDFLNDEVTGQILLNYSLIAISVHLNLGGSVCLTI